MQANTSWLLYAALLMPVLVLVSSRRSESDMHEVIEGCLKAHNLTEQDLDAIGKGATDVAMNVKCYANCFLERMQLLDARGKFDIDKVKTMDEVEPQRLEAMNNCKAQNDMEESGCEYGFKMMTCLFAEQNASAEKNN